MVENDHHHGEHRYVDLDESEQPSTAVVTTVASMAGTSPEELEPLYYTVDPDALDRLFAPATESPAEPGKIEFDYCGYRVAVSNEPSITITTG